MLWQEQEHVGDYDNTKIYSSTIHMFQNVENVICEYKPSHCSDVQMLCKCHVSAVQMLCKCCANAVQMLRILFINL